MTRAATYPDDFSHDALPPGPPEREADAQAAGRGRGWGLRPLHWRMAGLMALTFLPIKPVSFLAGVVLFAFIPGACLLSALRIGERFDRVGRWVMALAVSLVVVPVVANALWHITNDGLTLRVVWFVLLSLAVSLPRAERSTSASPPVRFFDHRATRWYAGFVLGLLLIATIGPYWPTERADFPVPSSIHDYIKHHAVLDSLARHTLPLGNVFYADGAEGPAYYYHFFYLIPATLHLLSGVSHEFCFGFYSFLVAAALTGLVYLATKRLKPGDGPATLAATLVAVVGGLDIIPVALHYATGIGGMFRIFEPHFTGALAGRAGVVAILDDWAENAYLYHPLLKQMIWTPQNVLGTLAVVLGVVLLGHYSLWRGWFIWGPLLAVSLIGSSPWVAMGILPALAIWGAGKVVALRRDGKAALRTFGALAVVAGSMFLCALPILAGYLEMSGRLGRSLSIAWPENAWSLGGRLYKPGPLANLIDAPLLMPVDLGASLLFLLGVGAATWRRVWRDDGLRLLAISAAGAGVACLVVRSTFYFNDFGQRILHLPLVFGAIVGACILDGERARGRWWNPLGWQLDRQRFVRRRRLIGGLVIAVLVLSLPMTVYEVPFNTVYRHIHARHLLRAEKNATQFMRYGLPADAVVQAHWGYDRAKLAQTIRRQIGVMADQDDVVVFRPADQRAYRQAVDDVRYALDESDSAAETHRLLRKHGITHVYLGDIERWLCRHLEKFGDRTYFRMVFEENEDRVFELLDVPGAHPRAGSFPSR